MELIRVTHTKLNITTTVEILGYTYTGTLPIEVIARADLGDVTFPIAGSGNYIVQAYINNAIVSPDIVVPVGAGVTRTTVVSRVLPLEPGDLVSIRVQGMVSDTQVDTVTSLRDATPLILSDITGGGSVEVDQNYGGSNALAYETALGVGIPGATILCYLQSDYNAMNRGNAFVVSQTTTTTGGAWTNVLNLNPATYTFIFSKAGLYGPDRADVIVLPPV